jgi:hypothetical protein
MSVRIVLWVFVGLCVRGWGGMCESVGECGCVDVEGRLLQLLMHKRDVLLFFFNILMNNMVCVCGEREKWGGGLVE